MSRRRSRPPQWRRHCSKEKVGYEVGELLRIDRPAEDAIPGRRVRHRRAVEAEQVGEGRGAQPRPGSNGTRAGSLGADARRVWRG